MGLGRVDLSSLLELSLWSQFWILWTRVIVLSVYLWTSAKHLTECPSGVSVRDIYVPVVV
ncbi:hypothetical protein J6590_003968 [Homalodisca vitripennis]|nr:hypothetical protein J6590_003968 [Homalodisca vitripennis]